MTSFQGQAHPSEEDVHNLVERIIDGVVAAEGSKLVDSPVPSQREQNAGRGSGENRIAVGADHGGYPLKERIVFKLREAGYDVTDCGTDSHDSVDYPDLALAVAEKVASGECLWGIVIDGAGIGSAMVANKVPGVRAALCYDISSAATAVSTTMPTFSPWAPA